MFMLCIHVHQALMPVAVFLVGCSLGTEVFSVTTLLNMAIVSGGVAIASFGTHDRLCACYCNVALTAYTLYQYFQTHVHTLSPFHLPLFHAHANMRTCSPVPPPLDAHHFQVSSILC